MKKGDRVICKSDNRHGIITDVCTSCYGIKYYGIAFDVKKRNDINPFLRKNLKLESSLWQRIINKLKNK